MKVRGGGMSGFIKTLIIIASILVVMLLGWYIYTQIRNDYIRKQKMEALQSSMDQIKEMRLIGLSESDPRMQMVQEQIAKTEQELNALKRWNPFAYSPSPKAEQHKKIATLLTKTKTVMAAYKQQFAKLKQERVVS